MTLRQRIERAIETIGSADRHGSAQTIFEALALFEKNGYDEIVYTSACLRVDEYKSQSRLGPTEPLIPSDRIVILRVWLASLEADEDAYLAQVHRKFLGDEARP